MSEGGASRARRPELDFLRGLALIVMAVGHPIRADIYSGAPIDIDPIRLFMNWYGEIFSGLFMFISGINVQNFLKSAERDPGLDPTAFYVKSSAALFALGWTYNLTVGTALFIDIIQCIAVGTLVCYLFLRYRAPTWAIAAFTFAMFAAILVIVGPGPVTAEDMARVRPYRYWVSFFGPIPWVGFFTYGLVIDRLRERGEGMKSALMIGGAALFVAGHALPALRGTEPAVHLLKVNARFLVLSIGLFPAALIACERFYQGRSKAGKVIEYWGLESLVFLVFHWVYIFYLGIPQLWVRERFGENASVWFTGLLTLAIMSATVRPIATLRDRWLRAPAFARRAWTVLAVAMVGWAWATARLAGLATNRGIAINDLTLPTPSGDPLYLAFFTRQNGAFLAAATFCFLYPHLRKRFRETSRIKGAMDS